MFKFHARTTSVTCFSQTYPLINFYIRVRFQVVPNHPIIVYILTFICNIQEERSNEIRGKKQHLQILAKYRRAMMVHESQLEQQKRVNISRAK